MMQVLMMKTLMTLHETGNAVMEFVLNSLSLC